MNRIEQISIAGKDIFIIDYSGCKERQMVDMIVSLKEQILTFNKPVSVLSIFTTSYATPAFMQALRVAAHEVNHLLEKEVVVGLSNPKKMILKGYNLLFNKNVQAFDTREEAMKHLFEN